MTKQLSKVLKEASKLSPELQDEIASQLLTDIENETQWQSSLEHPNEKLNNLANRALKESSSGKTIIGGFDRL